MGIHEIHQLAIAAGLGLMVGIQRQGEGSPIAGIRTYPVITVFGYLSGLLGLALGGWLVGAALAVVAAFIILGNVQLAQMGSPQPGMTSEFAAVVMFAAGALLALDWNGVAVVASGIVLVLLQAKGPLHSVVGRLTEADRSGLAQLVLLGFVILPALPNRDMGPMGVLNPYDIWRMVVLIVGISMAAYIAYKFLGGRAGTLLGGLLGGLISSTASTLTFSRMTKEHVALVPGAAVMILLASTVVFGRLITEVALVAPSTLSDIGPPLLTMMLAMALVCWVTWRWGRGGIAAPAPDDPPSDLKSAVLFGALYAVILVAMAFAQRWWGDQGLFAVSFLSGLTDTDAITLSAAKLASDGIVSTDTGWRMILVGGISNLLFKGGLVVVAGDRALRKPVLLGFGASIAAGALILLLWP